MTEINSAVNCSQAMPRAAWAWEYLRRNKAYRRDWNIAGAGRQRPVSLFTGASLIRERRRWRAAEKWGLLTFADPFKPAIDADVFWSPDLLAGALPVDIRPSDPCVANKTDEVRLSTINTRRVILETANNERHILLNGERFWVQLCEEKPKARTDHGIVGFGLFNAHHFSRRVETAAQLLSLYQCAGGKLSLIGRAKNTMRLAQGLAAFDIVNSGGTHRDVAIAVFGNEIIEREWLDPSEHYRDRTRKLIKRAFGLVDGGYKRFLSQKNL